MNNSPHLQDLLARLDRITSPRGFHHNEKFRNLPYWMEHVTRNFEKEVNQKLPRKYFYYKRGAVIRVNFGVNEGSEFSNLHFAVVLDKKDSPKKRTVTVLPLTSKQSSDRFDLGKEVFNQTIVVLRQQGNEMIKRIANLEKRIQQTSEEHMQLQEDIESEIKELESDIEKLRIVSETYSNFNKNSYVRLNDITTVSKLKIRRINKFDPSGSIRLSSKQMKQISEELMKLYISD